MTSDLGLAEIDSELKISNDLVFGHQTTFKQIASKRLAQSNFSEIPRVKWVFMDEKSEK